MKNTKTKDIYKKGYVIFMNQKITVTTSTYIPTPETEKLVIETIKQAKSLNAKLILDIGTGSGALAISIAKKLPNLQIIATDISQKALIVAQENIKNHRLSKSITTEKSNYVDNLNCLEPDIIIADLPWGSKYSILKSNQIRSLKEQPKIAIFHPNGPMGAYKELFESIQKKGWNNSIVIFETGLQTKISVDRILPPKYNLKIKEWKKKKKLHYSIGIAWKRMNNQ